MELEGQDAVAEIDEARAGVALHDALAVLCRSQDLQVRRGRRHAALTKPVAAFEERREQGRTVRHAGLFHQCARSDRVHRFEGTHFPPEAPLHRAVDVIDRVRDRGRHFGCVHQREAQDVAKEVANFVQSSEQRPNAFRRILNRARRFQRRKPRRLLLSVCHRGRIEREDRRARRRLLFLVEPLSSLVADPPALDHGGDERRQCEIQVLRDVNEDVDARKIHRPERRALRPPERRAGDRVNLFD